MLNYMFVVTLPPPPEPSWNQPGGLRIKERRTWMTWQLVTALVVVFFIGMAVGHSGGGADSTASASGAGGTVRTLPPDNSNTTVVTPTTVARSSTTIRSSPSSSTTTIAASGPETYLLRNQQGTGPQNLPVFTIAGGVWRIGWQYSCEFAPGGASRFQILIGSAAGPPTTAVDEHGRSGSGVASATSTGRQQLQMRTNPACRWAVTVVGHAG
jgi:hypothetical protein